MIPPLEELTIEGFRQTFRKIIEVKERSGIKAILDNPPDLFERAKMYGTQYSNGAWGWASNIWHRSASGSVVIERDEELRPEHKLLMQRVLEHILAQGPLIKIDAVLGKPGTKVEMRCRLYCDPQFPDIAYRWKQLCFPGDPEKEPDVELFCIPHYLGNPNVPGSNQMLRVLRFPNHNYTIVTCSSYQGEVKKGFLTHWIYFVYKVGGIGEHAALREFTVKDVNGKRKRIIMCIWGLTGSGKSTHGMYVFNELNSKIYIEKFGINPLDYVSDQVIKNDDVVAILEDRVIGSECGTWTKTEDVDLDQIAIWNAATSPNALHENTEFDARGLPSFEGRLFTYYGSPNRNSRSVLRLSDTGYYDGNPESSGPMNVAVFISPGYFVDYAWVKITDPAFAAKVLADGRSVGHPAQSREVFGVVFETRYCLPFTMGVSSTAHVVRFYEFLKKWQQRDEFPEIYQINTTGKIVSKYRWTKKMISGHEVEVPEPLTEIDEYGERRIIGGTSPTIEETELFLLQAVRGAVKYAPHPIWGEKVLVPISVEGLSSKRLRELDPFNYLELDEAKRLLKVQIMISKHFLDQQCPGLPREIYEAMDFE